MTFWLDVNIPPVMCAWLEELGYVAHSFRGVGWLTESDIGVFRELGQPGNVLITKHGDFRELVLNWAHHLRFLWH